MNKNISLIVLLVLFFLIILGGFLRIFRLYSSPPSLNWDEAALGYNAYSISETLRDEYGQILPVFTRSFDDYKSAIPIYLIIPSIKVFGLNETGVRFPSAFLSTLSIILIFLISLEVFRNQTIALASSAIFSIEPWTVAFSRTYQEATDALFFSLAGLLLLLLSRKKKLLLPLSFGFWFLSMYTYHSYKILVPLFLTSYFLIIGFKKYPRKVIYLALATTLIFIVPFFYFSFKGEVFARIDTTNIFKTFPEISNALRIQHSLNGINSFILHNSIFYFIWGLVGRLLAYFSPQNLFILEPTEPTSKIGGISLFYPFEFIFWLVGIVFFIKNYNYNKELILLLLITPIPAILTWNWFQPVRVMLLFSIFSISAGLGLYLVVHYFTVKMKSFINTGISLCLTIFFLGLLYIGSAVLLFDSIMVQLPYRDYGAWQPGFKNSVPIVYELSKNYDQVIIGTTHAQPYIFYLFYSAYPPEQYLNEVDVQKIGKPRKFYDFGKFKFRAIYWPKDRNLHKTLFVGNESDLPDKDLETQPNTKVITETKDENGNISSKIVAND